jgi:hypothetical protein
MTAYLPIVLGQDALQWLRHLPRHRIDDWSDFSRRFTANFQSLSDKPAQPWDLKSIKHRGDETLRSYLKRFQTMMNRIPEVAEAAVIENFYRGSNDSAFVRAILQKVDWRMCVDYTNLNKHCPKDPFGLPRIDQVVDSTAGCSVLSFLDCYSEYHQISLAKEDEEKTTFITPFGAFCYTSMPFDLKNAGATYQRAI